MNIFNALHIRFLLHCIKKNIDTLFSGSETEDIVHNFAQNITTCLPND